MSGYCGGASSTLPGLAYPVDGSSEAFQHNDVSWPCMRNIRVDSGSDPNTLHYIQPSSYFEQNQSNQPHHMSLQRLDWNDRDAQRTDLAKPTFSLYSNTDGAIHILAQASVKYSSEVGRLVRDASLGVGSVCFRADGCTDTQFNPPSRTQWTQFAFTATVPAGVYAGALELVKETVVPANELSCQLDSRVSCEDNGQDVGTAIIGDPNGGCLTKPISVNDNASMPFGTGVCLCQNGSSIFNNLSCTAGGSVLETSNGNFLYNPDSKAGGGQIACAYETAGTVNTALQASGNVPSTYVSADFRDGYQRIKAENVTLDSSGNVLQPWYPTTRQTSPCAYNTPGDAGQLYTGYLTPSMSLAEQNEQIGAVSHAQNVPNQVLFESRSTCAPPPDSLADANSLVMMDVDTTTNAYPVRRIFTALKWVGGADTMPKFAQIKNDVYVVSWNAPARMPTCLGTDDVAPTLATANYDGTTFRNIDCYAQDGSNSPWTWRKNQDLGEGTGAYAGGRTAALDVAQYPDWPSVSNPVLATHPDIVVRLAFYNEWLADPATGNPVPLRVRDASFQSHLVSIFGMNKPGDPLGLLSSVSDSLLSSDMRRVAFLEYMAAVMYRSLFDNFLTTGPDDRWYTVGAHLIQTGKYAPYSESEFVRDYFAAFLPAAQLTTSASTSGTVQAELTTLAQWLASNVASYLRYPRVRYDAATNTFWMDFYCDLFTHLSLQNRGASMQSYLHNFFQDADLVIVQSGTNTVFAPNTSNPAPVLQLSGAATHDPSQNLVLTYNKLTFTSSYYWTQQIEYLSPVAMLALAIEATRSPVASYLSWFATLPWSTGLSNVWRAGVPQLLGPTLLDDSTYSLCLNTKPISSICRAKLCSGTTQCICDYSLVIGSVVRNPASELYFNNSLGACACLANQSTPLGSSSGVRALNSITQCFSKPCLEYGFDDAVSSSLDCAATGCNAFSHAVSTANKSTKDSSWEQAFADSGQDLDLTQLQSECDQTLKRTEATSQQPFFWNWPVLAGAVLAALALPIGVVVDAKTASTPRARPWFFYFAVVLAEIVVLGVGALLVYSFSGFRTCNDAYSVDNVHQGACKDRALHAIPLSEDSCTQAPATFCQCEDAETICEGYLNGEAQCAANHMCCVCANGCFQNEIATTESTLATNQISTGLTVAAGGAFLFAAPLIWMAVSRAIAKPTKIWDGSKVNEIDGRPAWFAYSIATLATLALGAALGVGVYYASPLMPTKKYTVKKDAQAADVDQDQLCGTST